MVPYVNEVVAVMCVLLFVLHVCLLRECKVDGNAGVGMDEVRGMWVVHTVQVWCLAQLTCYG